MITYETTFKNPWRLYIRPFVKEHIWTFTINGAWKIDFYLYCFYVGIFHNIDYCW